MEELKAKWNSFGLIGKILTIALFPFGLILVGMKLLSSIRGAVNDESREKTDEASSKLDQEKAKTDQAIAHENGKIEQLEQDKKEAVQHAQSEDPSVFLNDRYKSDK